MDYKQNKDKYVADNEFALIVDYLKGSGIKLDIQVNGPYQNTKGIYEQNGTTIYMCDTLGKLELVVLYKNNGEVTITQYSYTGYDYDTSKTPRLYIRHTSFIDLNDEFSNYLATKDLETFFSSEEYVKFINTMRLDSTFVSITTGKNTMYALIKGSAMDYTVAMTNLLLHGDKSIYQGIDRDENTSLISLGNYIIDNMTTPTQQVLKYYI